jgi:hypothetical protein
MVEMLVGKKTFSARCVPGMPKAAPTAAGRAYVNSVTARGPGAVVSCTT